MNITEINGKTFASMTGIEITNVEGLEAVENIPIVDLLGINRRQSHVAQTGFRGRNFSLSGYVEGSTAADMEDRLMQLNRVLRENGSSTNNLLGFTHGSSGNTKYLAAKLLGQTPNRERHTNTRQYWTARFVADSPYWYEDEVLEHNQNYNTASLDTTLTTINILGNIAPRVRFLLEYNSIDSDNDITITDAEGKELRIAYVHSAYTATNFDIEVDCWNGTVKINLGSGWEDIDYTGEFPDFELTTDAFAATPQTKFQVEDAGTNPDVDVKVYVAPQFL